MDMSDTMKSDKSQKTYSCLIIGAGAISAGNDSPSDPVYRTYGHAFSDHPSFYIQGFVDIDQEKANHASSLWGGDAYHSLYDAIADRTPDVAVVATPDNTHAPYMKTLSELPVRIILCEKPLASTYQDAKNLQSIFSIKQTKVLINYTRRYLPEFQNLALSIQKGEFGQLLCGNGLYGKGLLHNGSHLVDLIRFLTGEWYRESYYKKWIDYSVDDPSAAVLLRNERGAILFLNPVPSESYTLFELDLYFEKARVMIKNLGMTIEMEYPQEDKIFKGYHTLSPGKKLATSYQHAFFHVADHIRAILDEGDLPIITIEDGVKAVELCTV